MSVIFVFTATAAGTDAAIADNLAEHPEIQSKLRVFDAFNEAFVERNDLPSMTAGIVYGEDLIWVKSYGYSDLDESELAKPSTVYRIGSLSKVFTTLALLQLHEGSQIDLDDAVIEYLPWFQPVNNFGEETSITIRQLLEHRSGLPMDAPGVHWNDYTLPAREEIIDAFDSVALILPPGFERYYSNFGFWVAGEVLQAVTGNSVSLYVKRRLTEPLGMTHTTLVPSAGMKNLAKGYGPRRRTGDRYRWPFTDTSGYASAGDGASTVRDLARLLVILMSGEDSQYKNVIDPSTIRMFWGDRQPEEASEVKLLHGGDGGGFFAAYRCDSSLQLGVIILMNADDGDPLPGINLAFSLFGTALNAAAEGKLARVATKTQWEPYFGTYRSRNSRAIIFASEGRLFIADPRDENPWTSMTELRPVEGNIFRMIEVRPDFGELVTFDVTGDGRVLGIQFSNHYQTKD